MLRLFLLFPAFGVQALPHVIVFFGGNDCHGTVRFALRIGANSHSSISRIGPLRGYVDVALHRRIVAITYRAAQVRADILLIREDAPLVVDNFHRRIVDVA